MRLPFFAAACLAIPLSLAAAPAATNEAAPDTIVHLPRYEVRDHAISDFGMSIVTNFGVLFGGGIKWMTVGQVVPGSSAALAGLRTGDGILTINDRPLTELNRKSMLATFFARPIGTRLRLMVRQAHNRHFQIVELKANRERIAP